MQSLAGLNLSEIEELLLDKDAVCPLPRFRVGQIYKWILRGVSSFSQMSDLPASLREQLSERFSVLSSSIVSCHDDNDAKKIVVALNDGLKIESVLLNDGKDRFTACLSTQAGCPAGCVFCKTGALGFKRNLTSSEIAEQLLHFIINKHSIDNIVVMGMGEPLLNLQNLRKALSFFTDKNGLNFSKRRITVSTCGICEGLFDIAQNGPYVRLALSLTTADEDLRQALMPVTRANPLKKIKEALVLFQSNGGGRVTLEIPLLGGVNTRDKDALAAVEFAEGIDSVINIIPWNPVDNLLFNGKPLAEPDKNEVKDFIGKLESSGLKVTTRFRKGRRVMGACGQLGSI